MKNKNKNIIFFNAFYLPHLGGVEKYTSNIVNILKKKYNIYVITTNSDDKESYIIDDTVNIYRLPSYNLFKNRYPILKKNKEYRNIIKKINSIDADYVICNTRFYETSLLGAKYAKEHKSKLMIIDHSSNHVSIGIKLIDKLGAYYEHFLTYKLKKYNPEFYGVSKKCNEWLKHFNIDAKGVFYNAIDKNVYKEYHREVKNNKIEIGYMGRIIKEKGVINLLDAFTKIQKKYPNIHLSIAGDGPILENLKKEYKSNNITFLGKLNYEEVYKLANKLDIFVHPSMYPEGLPTSILEAGLLNTAVIATDRGGTREIIKNDNIGIIIEENSKSIEKALEKLINDRELMNKLKNNIHEEVAKNFTWEKTVNEIIKELEK